jgi:hypothetical protein
MMKIHNDLTQKNLKIDDDLLQTLKRLRVVETQYDLSELCGKGRSYYSCMRTNGYGLKLGSLTFLSVRLGSRMNACQDPKVAAILKRAQTLVQKTIEAKCRLQERGLWQRAAVPRGARRLGGQSHAD